MESEWRFRTVVQGITDYAIFMLDRDGCITNWNTGAQRIKGPHHGDARCVDCHLPHDTVAKYFAKALNGYHHSKGFTLQDFHEPILIKPRNAQILQDNCLRCHGDFVHDAFVGVAPAVRAARAEQAVDDGRCVHCHRGAGHGARG